jgi:para-nitrobenzyl esterase
MKHKTTGLGALTILCGLVAGCGGDNTSASSTTTFGAGGASTPEMRTTTYGTIVGVNDANTSGTYYWKGVPFAKPPVGALRWKAPLEPDAWAQPLATQKYGKACIQNGRVYGPGANNT